MDKIDLKQICNYLDEVNWHYLLIEQENLILTGWRARVPHYSCSMPVEIWLSRHWVVIQGVILKRVPAEQQLSVLTLLSSLNQGCRQARYFVEDHRVILQTEVSIVRCNANSFWEALENICRNFNASGPEISVVATNPSVGNLLKRTTSDLTPNIREGESDEDERLTKFQFAINSLRTT